MTAFEDGPAFGDDVRGLRKARGWSLAELAAAIPCDKGHLSRIETGARRPTVELAARIDAALAADGAILARHEQPGESRPWETAELLRRVQADDTAPATLEALQGVAVELCCRYSAEPAALLRREAHGWLRETARLVRRPTGLAAHRELLAIAGWFALLVGCLEYDLGMRAAAEATRIAARQLGEEAGHAEISAWSQEMAAWFALTQSRHDDVLVAARAGQAAAPVGSAAVQLAGQEAKALARLGDAAGARAALERGRSMLASMPAPARPEHHFAVDPGKCDFYAMDAYRLTGDDEQAAAVARAVLAAGDRAPMRATEARLTLAIVAARKGELEQAVALGVQSLSHRRRSLPSLLMVAGELEAELRRRFPGEPAAGEFAEAVRSIRSGGRPRPGRGDVVG